MQTLSLRKGKHPYSRHGFLTAFGLTPGRHWPPATLMGLGALLVLAVLVVYPVCLVIGQSFQAVAADGSTRLGLGGWLAVVETPSLQRAIGNSLAIMLVVTAITIPAGFGIAWLLARTDLPGRDQFEFLFWLAYFLPTLTVTLSWILVLDPKYGLLNQVIKPLGLGPLNIYSFGGIVWVHLVSLGLAVKVILFTPPLRNLDASFEEAASSSGASRLVTLARVSLPLLTPILLAVLLLSATRVLEAFEIEQILGPPIGFFVLSTKIFDMINQPAPRFDSAAALSVLMLLAVLGLIVLQQRLVAQRQFVTVTGKFRNQRARLGAWRWPLFALVTLVAVLMVGVPLVFAVMGTFMRLFGFFTGDPWTLGHWTTALHQAALLSALKNTAIIGLASAFAGVALYFGLAYLVVRSTFAGRRPLDLASWLPTAIPGIVLSFAFASVALNLRPLRPLYGTTLVLVLAFVVATMPLGVHILGGALKQISAELEEASYVSGGGWLRTSWSVTLPLLAPTLLVIGLIAFMAATRNVAQVALLSNSSNQPITMLQLNYIADGQLETASVVGCISMFLTVALALLARRLGYRTM
jgi:iron(III) transport system permease protein